MTDLKNKSVLITGAAGCIGATVVKQLREMGTVPVVYDLTENRSRLHLIMDDADEIVWELGDITDYDQLDDVMKRHDIFAIIHLAALQVPFCKANPVLSAKVNVVGSTNIIEAARQNGIKRLTYASSIAAPAMGDNDHLATLYGAHKICGEQIAAVYWQDWQVPSIGIRPGVIYGPGRDQGMSAAPTIAMLAAIEGLSYTVPFIGPVAFVYVEDAAARFIGAVSQDVKGAYVFDMQGTPMSVEDVVAEIKRNVPNCNIESSGSSLPFGHDVDDGQLDKLINAKPYRSMAEGIKQTLETYRSAYERGVLTAELAKTLIEKNS